MTDSARPPELSVWLLAAPDDERALAARVDALAGRFGTPRFHPHLTLAGDAAADPREVAASLAAACAATAAVISPIASVDTGPLYFRAFYARFAPSAPLVHLRAAAFHAVGDRPVEPFLPHVSLAYGVDDGPDREAARREVEGALAGVAVRFDRVAVVASSSSRPIADWRILETMPLAG